METEWNGTTTSDNPIDTGTGRTTRPTMEKVVVEAIETSEPTNNEQHKGLCVAVELDDTGGGGDGAEGPVITRFRTYQYRYPVPTTTKIEFLPWKRILSRRYRPPHQQTIKEMNTILFLLNLLMRRKDPKMDTETESQ